MLEKLRDHLRYGGIPDGKCSSKHNVFPRATVLLERRRKRLTRQQPSAPAFLADAPRRSEDYPPVFIDDQAAVVHPLQILNVLRDSRLGEVKVLRCFL